MAETVGGSLTIPFVFPVPEAPSAPTPSAPAPSGGGDPVGAVPAPAQPASPVGGEAALQTPAAPLNDTPFTPSAFFQPVTFDLTAPAGGMGALPVQAPLYEDIFRSFGDDDKYFWWL